MKLRHCVVFISVCRPVKIRPISEPESCLFINFCKVSGDPSSPGREDHVQDFSCCRIVLIFCVSFRKVVKSIWDQKMLKLTVILHLFINTYTNQNIVLMAIGYAWKILSNNLNLCVISLFPENSCFSKRKGYVTVLRSRRKLILLERNDFYKTIDCSDFCFK